MNSNVGGREHSAVYVERQIIGWFCELFGFGEKGSGILLGGTSMANFGAVLVARTAMLGAAARTHGSDQNHRMLAGYASRATHSCLKTAFKMAGLGSAALQVIDTDDRHRINLSDLEAAIARDKAAGATPFLIVGNAGTVDTGAIDPLDHLADIAEREKIWFHFDGAFGAMAMLSEQLPGASHSISQMAARSVRRGMLVGARGVAAPETFASEGPYITRMERGTASGIPWSADFGPDLSRGFRALKVWFTLKHFGTGRLAEAIEMNCHQARSLSELVSNDPDFELAAPVNLNVVCFRSRHGNNDAIAVQESGRAVLSSTTIEGERVLRACFTNHRTRAEDVTELFEAVKAALRSA